MLRSTSAITIVLVLLALSISSTYAQYGQPGGIRSVTPANTWRVGEDLQQGMYFKYELQHHAVNNFRPFEITFLILDRFVDGNWLVEFNITDGKQTMSSKIILDPYYLRPVGLDSSETIPPEYLEAYTDSIVWLAGFSYRGHPLSLNASSWGGYIPEENPAARLAPRSTEVITLPAGTFNATVVSWQRGEINRIWVVDNFPFPVKADVYRTDVWPQTKSYAFELLESGLDTALATEQGELEYPFVAGAITERGCNTIGGQIVQISSNGESFNTCKYAAETFLITYVPNCYPDRAGSWTDYDTNTTFAFEDSCDAPLTPKPGCHPPYDYIDKTIPIFVYHEPIVVRDSTFFVTIHISETTCQVIYFDPGRPSIKIEVDDYEDVTGFINVTMPADLLSGNFTLLVDGLPREYILETHDGYSTISFTQQYHYTGSRPHNKIEIIGSSTVPEFSSSLILSVTALSILALVRFGFKFYSKH